MLLRVIWFQSTKVYKWASSEELINPCSQHFKNCCRNFTLFSPLLVLRVRGAEAAHNHSAKNKLPKTVCKELPSAAYNSLYDQHHQKPKQPHPDTGASAAHPMLPAWGCMTAALMGTGTFEVTLAQTMPHLSLVPTKRLKPTPDQPCSASQDTQPSQARADVKQASQGHAAQAPGPQPQLVCSTFAAPVLKLLAYVCGQGTQHVHTGILFYAEKYFWVFRLEVGVFQWIYIFN